LVEKQIDSPVYIAGMGGLVEWIRRFERYFDRIWKSNLAVYIVPIRKTTTNRRYIEFECVRYLFDDRSNTFEEYFITMGPTQADLFRNLNSGLSSEEVALRHSNFGSNSVVYEGDTFFSGLKKE
jgi:hypothetical protein